MPDHPRQVARRIPPNEVQLQIVIGSLLGDARILGEPGARRLRMSHSLARESYAIWKYERLGALGCAPPTRRGDRVVVETIAHPLFDDLARLSARGSSLRDLLRPLGLAVWLTDVGRLELRARTFLPAQQRALLAA